MIMDSLSLCHFKPALTVNFGPAESVWGIEPDTALRCQRFQSFLRHLPHLLEKVTPPARVILCCISLEAITSRSDLFNLLENSSARLHLPGASRVSWPTSTASDRCDARSISSRTELALRRLAKDVDWISEVRKTEQLLQGMYPVRTTSPLDHLLEDGKAWWYRTLPACVLTHVLHKDSMPLLPDEVLARVFKNRTSNDSTELDDNVAWITASENDALDVALDLPQQYWSHNPRRTIELLKAACSVNSNESGIRLATYLNKESSKEKVALLSAYLKTEGWVAAAATSWVIHLLTFGSLRKSNPAMSTISAYVRSGLEPLCQVLESSGKPPGFLSQDEWRHLHKRLLGLINGPHQSATLASIHVWAIRTFGCDPFPEVIFQSTDCARVHLNVVWAHECNMALEQSGAATKDERTNAQIMVMLALGSSGLFRIGELPGLLTSDFERTDTGLRVRVDPGRGLHGGKSHAARRYVELDHQSAVTLLLQWQARRNEESRTSPSEKVLVFGDPNHKRKLYRFGQCTGMVNRLLKLCTEDDSVSFHTLRHTVASFRVLRMLSTGYLPAGVDPLDELCHQIGHAGPNTLAKTYSHLGEFSLRRAIDRVVEAQDISSTQAAFWLDQTRETLRQKKHRIRISDRPHLYFQLLRDAAWKDHPQGDPADVYAPLKPVSFPSPHGRESCDLTWVQHGLSLLQGGASQTNILLRLSCSDAQLRALCKAALLACRALNSNEMRRTMPTVLETAITDHQIKVTNMVLQKLKWDFCQPTGSLMQDLHKSVEVQRDQSHAALAANAWQTMQDKGVLDLSDPIATSVLIRFLRSSGFPPHCVVFRMQRHNDGERFGAPSGDWTEQSRLIAAKLADEFDARIRTEEVQPRRGFPKRYLLLSRSLLTPGRSTPSATLRMRDFNSLFFSLTVYLEIKKMGRSLA
jgi:site-specific recombinase XerD